MGGLLGPVGGLKELRCASALAVAPDGDDIMSITRVGSGREYAQLASTPAARVWDVEVGTARPEDMHELRQLQHYQRRQRTTLVYYSEDAQVENVLEPGASLMALADPDDGVPQEQAWTGLSPGGARVLPGEHLPGPEFMVSGVGDMNGEWAHLSNIPVPHNTQVTASVYVTAYMGAAARFFVDELDMANRTLDVWEAATPVATVDNAEQTTLVRLTHTFVTRPNTVALTFGVAWANTIVAPQLTLTDRPMPWVEGQGCTSALLMGAPTKQVQLAIAPRPGFNDRRSAYSWRIREMSRGTDY